MIKVNKSNYFSKEVEKAYMGSTQFKNFLSCEAHQLALINDEYVDDENPAFLLGSYVHSWNDGTMAEFRMNHPQMFRKDGELKAPFEMANTMIERMEKDEMFMKSLDGEKEKIYTFEMFGCWWKIMIDAINLEEGYFTDLKTSRDIYQKFYDRENAAYVNFAEFFQYDIQMAIYQKGVEIVTGKKLIPYISVVSKHKKHPDIEIINFTQQELDIALGIVETNIGRILKLKNGGTSDPFRCNRCDFCKDTKVVLAPIHHSQIFV